MNEWITNRNPIYEILRSKRRQINHLWVAENVQLSGRMEEIIHIAHNQRITVKKVSRSELDSIDHHHQGTAINVSGYPYSNLEGIIRTAKSRKEALFVLLLDQIQDPQNLGTLLRSAEAFGVHGVILPLARGASVTPAVVNASSGATELLQIAQHNLAQAMDQLKETGVWIVGLEDSPEAQSPENIDLTGGLGLVVGNEAAGLRRLVKEKCDLLMQLPMQGKIDSLNAAVAGSIALYLARQARA